MRCGVNAGLDRTKTLSDSPCARLRNATSKSWGGFSNLTGRSDKRIACAARSADWKVSSETESHSTPRRVRVGNASTNSLDLFRGQLLLSVEHAGYIAARLHE